VLRIELQVNTYSRYREWQGVGLDSNRVPSKCKLGVLPIKVCVQYAINLGLNKGWIRLVCATLISEQAERRRMQCALLLESREQGLGSPSSSKMSGARCNGVTSRPGFMSAMVQLHSADKPKATCLLYKTSRKVNLTRTGKTSAVTIEGREESDCSLLPILRSHSFLRIWTL
jgi:hypothetical protein